MSSPVCVTCTTAEATPEHLSVFEDFRLGAGNPSTLRDLDSDERFEFEYDLISLLRQFVVTLAHGAFRDTPTEFAKYVDDLLYAVPHEAAMSARDGRLAGLLHAYADYMPASRCEFVDLGIDTHGWLTPDGVLVVDCASTRVHTQIDPGGRGDIHRFTSLASGIPGARLAGVRVLVLDSPAMSTWNPVGGGQVPLIGSEVDPGPPFPWWDTEADVLRRYRPGHHGVRA